MDKLTEKYTEEGYEKEKKNGLFSQIGRMFAESGERAKNDQGALAKDLLLFAVGFLLTRAHLVFGAHPIGLAFVSVLPFGIWSALLGCVIGALSMGLSGVVFAASAVISVFLRAAISCGEHNDYGFPHRELMERLAAVGAAAACSFIREKRFLAIPV